MSGVSESAKTELFSILTRPPYPSLAVAAGMAGLEPQTVYNLNASDREWKERWQNERARDRARRRDAALLQLEGGVETAVAVITASLESDDESVRLKTAWKLIETIYAPSRRFLFTESEPQRPITQTDRLMASLLGEEE
jgi:hypothetical protein